MTAKDMSAPERILALAAVYRSRMQSATHMNAQFYAWQAYADALEAGASALLRMTSEKPRLVADYEQEIARLAAERDRYQNAARNLAADCVKKQVVGKNRAEKSARHLASLDAIVDAAADMPLEVGP
jgi:intergrase/recombinase